MAEKLTTDPGNVAKQAAFEAAYDKLRYCLRFGNLTEAERKKLIECLSSLQEIITDAPRDL